MAKVVQVGTVQSSAGSHTEERRLQPNFLRRVRRIVLLIKCLHSVVLHSVECNFWPLGVKYIKLSVEGKVPSGATHIASLLMTAAREVVVVVVVMVVIMVELSSHESASGDDGISILGHVSSRGDGRGRLVDETIDVFARLQDYVRPRISGFIPHPPLPAIKESLKPAFEVRFFHSKRRCLNASNPTSHAHC